MKIAYIIILYPTLINRVKILVLFGYIGQYDAMINDLQYKAGRIYTPLGKVLFEARTDKGLSRAKLAKLAGIGENSIVRYEKAGLDEDGQWPPADRLAKLCLHLDISPQQVLWASLPIKEFRQVEGRTFDEVMNHPDYCFMLKQYNTLIQRNYFLGEALKIVLRLDTPKENEFPFDEDDHAWLIEKIKEVVGTQEAFEHRMLLLGVARPYDHGQLSVPSEREDAWVTELSESGKLPLDTSITMPSRMVQSSYIRLRQTIRDMETRFPDLNSLDIDAEFDLFADMKFIIGSEEDLPSPPSPNPKPTKPNLENDDGQSSE